MEPRLASCDPRVERRTAAQWEGRQVITAYIIDTRNGRRTKLNNKTYGNYSVSPGGQYVYWYDPAIKQYFIYNVDNGERFSTYIILAEAGSGTISMNGAAARRVQVGDRVIIAAYGQFDEAEVDRFQPSLVYLGENNEQNR